MNVKLLTSLISVFLLCPLIYLLYSVIGLSLDTFIYLWNNLLLGYSLNTLYLLLLTVFFSLILGIIPAWFVSTTNFKGKSFFDIILFLPLAIPSYIIAFTYSDLLSYTGPIQSIVRNNYPDLYKYVNHDYLQIEILAFLMALVYILIYILHVEFLFHCWVQIILIFPRTLECHSFKLFLRLYYQYLEYRFSQACS